tara:strand:+ start:579 stop:968 length:390 start_codon:yes stop_codon:yes gene_type:complete
MFNFKVYYEDTDSGGVVYYANYLKFLERARTELIHSLGLTNKKLLQSFDLLFVVRSCEIEYLKPAYLEDLLAVRTNLEKISKVQMYLNQFIFRDKEIIVKARIRIAFVNSKGNILKLPNELSLKLGMIK